MQQFAQSMFGGPQFSEAEGFPTPPLTTRRAYDAHESYLLTMLRLGSSVGPKVLMRKDFWLLLSVHLCAFAFYNNGYMGQKDGGWRLSTLELEWSDVELMFILMSCALCFAVNQAYFRYLHLGHLVRKMMDSVYDFAFEARLFLRKENQPYDRLGCRWAVGSLVLVLCEIRRSYADDTVQQPDLLKMVDLEFLRPGEADFLERLSARQRTLVMMHTACDCALHGLRKEEVAPPTLREILQRLVDCKTYQLQLLDAANSMLPFEYFHLLSTLMILTTAYLGLCMGICDSWMAPPAYTASLLIILGLFELLNSLNYPFDGVHEADFPLNTWVTQFLTNLSVLLNYSHGGTQSSWEAELQDEVANPVQFPLSEDQVKSILTCDDQRLRLQRKKVAPGAVAPAPGEAPASAPGILGLAGLASAGGSAKTVRFAQDAKPRDVPWYQAAMGYKPVETEEAADESPLLSNARGLMDSTLGRMGLSAASNQDAGTHQSRDMHIEERSRYSLW